MAIHHYDAGTRKLDVAAHWRVRKVALEIAGTVYDAWAHQSNEFYKQYPSRKKYCVASWGLYIDQAREALAEALNSPNLSDSHKEEIYDALTLDNTLRESRRRILQARMN